LGCIHCCFRSSLFCFPCSSLAAPLLLDAFIVVFVFHISVSCVLPSLHHCHWVAFLDNDFLCLW
jgi:hypothetical protein